MGALIKIALDILEIIFIAIAVFVLVYFFVGQPLEITGMSMAPTFQDKEQIVAEKLSIKYKPLNRGEVVIFNEPENNRMLIKRVIGLPLDTVLISEGEVYINGSKLNEPYLNNPKSTLGSELIRENELYNVPEGQYVLMGDNREHSSDSRKFGAVKQSEIIGRGFMVYFPIKNIRIIENDVFEKNNVLSETTTKSTRTFDLSF